MRTGRVHDESDCVCVCGGGGAIDHLLALHVGTKSYKKSSKWCHSTQFFLLVLKVQKEYCHSKGSSHNLLCCNTFNRTLYHRYILRLQKTYR